MHLYDRATRKFKENMAIWKEYMHFLVRTKSLKKLNRVVSSAVQIHPQNVDFWLIGAYTELDVKGNLFSSRNFMLQALRTNETNAVFHLEYLKFELKFLEKIMMRREVLGGGKPVSEKLDFVDDCEDEEPEPVKDIEGEIKLGEEGNLVKIVVANILKAFVQTPKDNALWLCF